tara:strand:+ start:442 stop:621 length:180 start_codon:yes stop_codon:yes gene_type:complete
MIQLQYLATNKNNDKLLFWAYGDYTAKKHNKLNAKNWIINHLDLSEKWSYKSTGKFRNV